jgi:hypothetical protein
MALKNCKECGKEVSSAAKVCPHCGKRYPTGGVTLPAKIALIIIGLWVFSKYISVNDHSRDANVDDHSAIKTVLSEKDIADSLIIDFEWSKGGFGNIMIVDFTISNPSDHTVKDMEITCTHTAKSGTDIDSNKRTIFDTVPANSTKVFKNFNMGFIRNQVKSSYCHCTDLKIVN